jgi:superfamily II RNA helicase
VSEPTSAVTTTAPGARRLGQRLPQGTAVDPDQILDRFLGWATDSGFTLYPAQEEALLELMAGRHVILATPTGSGKSLVALGLHFKGLCEGRRSFYTSPIKALASEKFFALCDELGPANVGMLTGDASINNGAPVICCTAEVLSNMALREGEALDAPYVVMDEFHYYGDPERGVAWQVPLLTLPSTQFLLMSATLGDTTAIAGHLSGVTGREVTPVTAVERPVPLEFEYRETSLHETVEVLLATRRAPVYIVSFTQKDCAELAQALTSAQVATREERAQILAALGGFRFDTAYGKEVRRFLSFGVGIHHAGLLPKYRLLVEQLSQQGLLKVICGTDTLGVGVNIPIRTVLFSGLAKFDGRKVGILAVRDFKQIAGRAGRKGFDDQGWVVAQAPEHVVENLRLTQKAVDNPKAKKLLKRKKQPAKGEVSWSRETFEALVARPPETLRSQFKVDHGMVLALIQRDAEADDPDRDNFFSLRRLIARCHEDEGTRRRLLSRTALLVRSLYRAGVIRMVSDTRSAYRWVVVDEGLQLDFSLHQALSLFLLETLGRLAADSPIYALDLLSVVEAILESPDRILLRQQDKARRDRILELKAQGMVFEERQREIEEITWPKPLADFLYAEFDAFRRVHPWVAGRNVAPKGIGRELYEGYLSFGDFVRKYGLERSEGVLLRYLSQLYKTLSQTVPDQAKSDEVWQVLGYLRAVIERTDTSLLEEWESLLHPEVRYERPERKQIALGEAKLYELLHDPKAFLARVRAELHQLVKALAEKNYEEASFCVHPEEGEEVWTPERFEQALAPFYQQYQAVLFTPEARWTQWTRIEPTGERTWEVSQVLLDPAGDHLWALQGEVDLTRPGSVDGPLVRLRRIGP